MIRGKLDGVVSADDYPPLKDGHLAATGIAILARRILGR
jgi:hypothetical protein